jgi:PAS domain S-box-containing protein
LIARELSLLAQGSAEAQLASGFLAALPLAVCACDAAGRLTYRNARAHELCGESAGAPEPIRFEGLFRVFRRDEVALRADELPLAVVLREGRASRDVELAVERHDGVTLALRVSAEPIRAPDGRLAGAVAFLEDITDRKRVQELEARVRALPTAQALHESETRLRLATNSGKLGIWDWDIVHNRVAWTDSLHEIHGVDRATFPGTVEAFAALVHPEDRPPVERAIRSSLEHDVPYELEFRAVRPGGRVIWLYTNATVVRESGRPVRMLGATFDITARKQAELGLRESELRFRALASHAPVGIFLTDVNGDALFVNDTWRSLAGLAQEQVRGRGWLDALHPDDRERVSREWYEAVAARTPFESEYRFRRPDGSVVWLQGSAVEFRNSGSALLGYIGTVADITQRKVAEEALRESERRFRTLASHAPVGIFLTDAKGETVFVNESWCAMTGLPAEEAKGFGWARAMHVDDRARVAAEWTAALAENRASAAEYRFVGPDGTITWVQGKAVQLRDESGRLAGYIGTVADFTQRKAAEERLQEQESQLRLITMNAPIILVQCDAQERYRFVNHAYTEGFRRPAAAVLGRTVREVVGGAAYAQLSPFVSRALGGEAFVCELEMDYHDIGPRFMRAAFTPERDAGGVVRGYLCAISDMTERRKTELALRESESRFRELANAMPQLVWSADERGEVEYYNSRHVEYAGIVCTEGTWHWQPMLHPDDMQATVAAWQSAVRNGEAYQMEHRVQMRDGSWRWHLSRALPMRNEEGRVVRWFGTATDIHDTRVAQEALHEAQRQLQAHALDLERHVADRTASLREAIAQMEEFSYSVSHDLRAPLRAMNAYAQALVEDYGARLDDTARNYLDRIQRSSVRMEKLTHDVLNYSRVARAEIALTALDLEVLLHDVVLQYRELQAPAAEVQIIRPLLGVRGHEASLGQCCANLLTNAAKFVAPGVKPLIRVSTEPRGERVRVWFEDNGIGIAPEYQARLFRVFERVPTRQAYNGTGIGLAIVRKAVEKMGGACGVESDGRNGSRFWIDLPKP